MGRTPKIQIRVKYEDFVSYKELYGTNKLDENSVIWAPTKKFISKLFTVNKIFDGIETKYQISKNGNNYLILFKSKSGEEYRFDLFKDPDDNIYHLGFGLSNTNDIEYEHLTNKNESLDVFNRLIWILRDIRKNVGISRFIIGITDNEKKNRIYQYMMGFISGWKKIDTAHYDTAKGIYFEL